jgi:molecular chaperone DnaK
METINEAWKNASEEMYKAQEGASKGEAEGGQSGEPSKGSSDDDVTDVEFEEVKEEE